MSYYGNINFDIDDINSIEYRRYETEDYDEDDNEIMVTCYDLSLYDKNDEVIQYLDGLTEEDIEDIFDERILSELKSMTKDRGYLSDLISNVPDNPNDVESVNYVAKKLWTNTDYVADARGYILTDGSLCYFGEGTDHMSICWIDGMTIGRFVQLGNIRCGTNFFQLEKEPTRQQRAALRELIAHHKGDELYFDICKYSGKGTYPDNISSSIFKTHNPRIVLNQIDRYFAEGIKPDEYYTDDEDDF